MSTKTKLSVYLQKYLKTSDKTVYLSCIKTPVGTMIAGADDDFLYMVLFEDSKNIDKNLKTISEKSSCTFKEGKNKLLNKLEDEMNDYFNGKLLKFTVPLKTFGTEFQEAVWNKLLEIPYGSTDSYGNLAKGLGRSASHSRAVGAACGANSHLILIPCHRMVASNSMGGFTGGLDKKDWLINHEKKFS